MSDEFVTFKVNGLKELEDKLEELDEKLQKKTLRAAIKAGCDVFYKAILALAPRATGFLAHHFGTKIHLYRGELAASGFVGPQGKIDYPNDAAGHYQIKRSKKGKPRKAGRVAVATVARFLEFGTSKMKTKHPFMTQAFESSKSKALDAVADTLREDLF